MRPVEISIECSISKASTFPVARETNDGNVHEERSAHMCSLAKDATHIPYIKMMMTLGVWEVYTRPY
ncbi:unnamed protein product [Clonostachys solani]|uniref:Uncharacterized protein n=1 Tax=Clonostachys solani TaxID=160281 RepID=A0A9N9ZCW1_9HYPO|nr:unnamed protein product [Clonostachys solani]